MTTKNANKIDLFNKNITEDVFQESSKSDDKEFWTKIQNLIQRNHEQPKLKPIPKASF